MVSSSRDPTATRALSSRLDSEIRVLVSLATYTTLRMSGRQYYDGLYVFIATTRYAHCFTLTCSSLPVVPSREACDTRHVGPLHLLHLLLFCITTYHGHRHQRWPTHHDHVLTHKASPTPRRRPVYLLHLVDIVQPTDEHHSRIHRGQRERAE